ncbi:hypothetical protein ACH45E_06715 [Streptomyces sp. NPDC020299]|uniref:hypothetical protein n=1 Tax=Streptomyces sp. NPDC020299 TaxID=3365067 RepID=UPI0037A694F3
MARYMGLDPRTVDYHGRRGRIESPFFCGPRRRAGELGRRWSRSRPSIRCFRRHWP